MAVVTLVKIVMYISVKEKNCVDKICLIIQYTGIVAYNSGTYCTEFYPFNNNIICLVQVCKHIFKVFAHFAMLLEDI